LLIAVVSDEDGELGYLIRPGPCAGERATDVVERLARLNRQIAGTDELALLILWGVAKSSGLILSSGIGSRSLTPPRRLGERYSFMCQFSPSWLTT
jgi:hypothetical protein